jgi:hypothetical protein
MLVHLVHKHNAHQIFLAVLADSVRQVLKLHRMIDGQFLRYQTVLGIGFLADKLLKPFSQVPGEPC